MARYVKLWIGYLLDSKCLGSLWLEDVSTSVSIYVIKVNPVGFQLAFFLHRFHNRIFGICCTGSYQSDAFPLAQPTSEGNSVKGVSSLMSTTRVLASQAEAIVDS